jgi:NAD(P)-dependent dehydrogenase (short-subunit alcohol dehydrogenase family)
MRSETTGARFAGKVAIVTGAGAGIGRATAVRLATEGARVVAADVVQDRLDDLVKANAGLSLTPVVGDITSSNSVDQLVAAAGDQVDVLANVAGIMDGFLPAAEVDDGTWERVFAVNVTAVLRLTRAVLPMMLEVGSGAIVNVTSEAGLRGSAAGVAYTASKHAVIGITLNTAFIYGPKGVRCNAVAPGPVATSIEAPWRSQVAAERIGPVMQRVLPPTARPEQLAAAICWLASDDSANVNGVVLPSDGGWSAL